MKILKNILKRNSGFTLRKIQIFTSYMQRNFKKKKKKRKKKKRKENDNIYAYISLAHISQFVM